MLTRRALIVASTCAAMMPPLKAAELERWTGKPSAPSIELLTTEGESFSLQKLRGKVVLVNFWATWCEPCVTEMPSLQQLHDELGPRGFEVLAVNYQEGPARITAFMQKMNLTLPVVRDTDGSVAKSWGARIFPASYLLDRNGSIRYAVNGAVDWTSAPVVSTIGTLLAAQPSRSR